MSKTLLRHLLDEAIIGQQHFDALTHADCRGDIQIFEEILRREYAPESSLLQSICDFFDLIFVGEIEDCSIDLPRVEQLGGLAAMKKNLIAPIVNGGKNIVFTANPFYKMPNHLMRITTRENIGKLLHDVEQGAPTSMDNPEELIRDMIENAVTQKASDIHLYYDPLDKISITKFRIDGYLKAIKKFCVPDPDLVYHQTLVNKIYGMSGLDPSQFQRIWDESFATSALKKTVSVRLSSMPQPEAASVVLRLIYARQGDSAVPIQSLGFDADVTAVLTEVLRMPDGIVLVSGPTGSGKTSTLYSLLNEKKKEPVNIVSVEDPIEMRIPEIRQVEVSRARDITFASAVRSFLRHDPDVILIGEIRDPETATEAIRASLTGHLVFSTIHTNSACGVIPRLIDLGISEEYIASTLRIVLSQRLVRALCPHCREKAVPSEQYKALVDKMFRPVGCKHCNNEGFKGRTVIWEMLVVTDAVKRAILQKKYIDEEYLINLGGSKPMREIAKRLVGKGSSTIEEIERFVTLKSRFSSDAVTKGEIFRTSTGEGAD